jgi:hypothetical protein
MYIGDESYKNNIFNFMSKEKHYFDGFKRKLLEIKKGNISIKLQLYNIIEETDKIINKTLAKYKFYNDNCNYSAFFQGDLAIIYNFKDKYEDFFNANGLKIVNETLEEYMLHRNNLDNIKQSKKDDENEIKKQLANILTAKQQREQRENQQKQQKNSKKKREPRFAHYIRNVRTNPQNKPPGNKPGNKPPDGPPDR